MIKSLLEHTARTVYQKLVPGSAKNSLRLWLLMDEQDKPPRALADFGCGSVLVIAPHMDDEVIGCGGVIQKHVAAGARTTVVYMTDGRRGDPQLYIDGASESMIRESEQALVLCRKEEAKRSAKILGIHETLFLDRADGELEAEADLVGAMAQIIQDRRPQVIYLPSVLDIHHDHWMTNQVFAAVARQMTGMKGWNPVCRQYEVWTPLLPNCVADISDEFGTKMDALRQFASQNKHVDYVHTTQGLNAYRSMLLLHGRGFAEAFFEGTFQQHSMLIERFSERR